MIIVFIPLLCFCAFAGWLLMAQRNAQKQDDQASESFWSREQRANSTRNKDISGLPLLQIAETELPDTDPGDETIHYYIGLLHENIKQPMMDLSAYSNTDLKLAYGVGNFKTLSDYDENFNSFLMNLSNLGKAYFQTGLLPEAASVFRLCLDSGSKSARSYKALADVYAAMGQSYKISELIKEAESSGLPRVSTLVEYLRQLL